MGTILAPNKLIKTNKSFYLIYLLLKKVLLESPTLELSSMLSGFSPPLQISHRVVPKPHLSVAKLRFWGFSMHSGGTQGMRSTRTERERERETLTDTCTSAR